MLCTEMLIRFDAEMNAGLRSNSELNTVINTKGLVKLPVPIVPLQHIMRAAFT